MKHELNIQYDENYKSILNYFEVKEWMEEYYCKYNILFFDNILPPLDRIILTPIIKNVHYLGIAYNQIPYKICLNFVYDMVELEWHNVLLHEMIHIWEYVMGYSGGHGKTFKMKAKEINNIGGWGITTSYKNILENLKYARDRQKDN